MVEYTAIQSPDRCPPHPGAVISDMLLGMSHSKVEIANMLGISRQHLYDILKENKPVSAAVAVRFGKLFGNGAAIWLRLQAAHDAWHAERDIDLSNVPCLVSAQG